MNVNPHAPLCPGCFKGNIRKLSNGKWRCKYNVCAVMFDEPLIRPVPKAKSKGIPAGRCISRQYRWGGSPV